MRGDITDGWVTLAGEFPPSLNSEDDPTKLKKFESPSCYGWSCNNNFLLQAGTCPVGTAQNIITKQIGSVNPRTWNWFYNRLWRAAGTTLFYGPPEYDDIVFQTGVGKITMDAAIVTFLPCLQSSIWVATASGSQILGHTTSDREWAEVKRLYQEFSVSTAANALVLDGIPVVSNTSGVFSFDGTKTTEWTRPIRNSLGSFSNQAILADYAKGWIIGTSKFVIDTQTSKLFDYGTVGNLFTTRTIAQTDGYGPFEVTDIAFVIQHSTTSDSSFALETKIEENDWQAQADVQCKYVQDGLTRIEVPFDQSIRTGHRFSLRVSGLDSEISIREIQICVRNLCLGSFSA